MRKLGLQLGLKTRGGDTTAPTITSTNTASVAENAALAKALTADEAVTWSIVGGNDQARFELSGSTLRWLANGTKNYEAPDDADANNVYLVTVRATDGSGNTADQAISVTVTDVAEAIPLAFVRSTTQPAAGPNVSQTAAVPAGTDPLWYTANGGTWTRIVSAFEDMPVTFASTANVTVTGRVLEKTSGGDTYSGSIVNSTEQYSGGWRWRAKILNSTTPFVRVGTHTNVDIETYWQSGAAGCAGFTGAGGLGASVANDILEAIVDFGANTVTVKKNGVTVAGPGAETSVLTSASVQKLGCYMYGTGGKVEILGFGPHGSGAPIKVAQTAPDGATWGNITVGHTHLRISNDAGVTTPSVVVPNS